jgi:hypothetical protein
MLAWCFRNHPKAVTVYAPVPQADLPNVKAVFAQANVQRVYGQYVMTCRIPMDGGPASVTFDFGMQSDPLCRKKT